MTALTIPVDKEWLTAAEAAADTLPGLPLKRALQLALAHGSLPSRRRSGRGGGREFHWTSLPREAREEYLKRYGVAQDDADRIDDPKAKAAQRDLKAEARAQIADAAMAFIAENNLTIGKGLQTFSKLYLRGRVKLDPWVRQVEPTAEPHQVRTWDRTIRHKGAGALIDGRGRPAGTRALDSDAETRAYVIAAIAARPQLSCTALSDAVRTDLSRQIPLRTLQRFVSEFRQSNVATLKGLTDPDRFRSHHKPAFGSRSAEIVRINQRWEIDATRADAMCRLPDGSVKRYALTALIDVFTRRAMVLVSDQPRALASMALLRRAILAWGLPELLKADNGKEFVARAMTRFLEDTGIKVSLSRPFTPEEKPHVERFFGTINRTFFPLLPGFVGHNIAERQAIEHRASFSHRFGEEARLTIETELSPEGLQARIDAWLADVYEQDVHSGLKQTPAQMALAFADQVKRVEDERVLDALLMDAPDGAGLRIVQKKGIRIESRYYIAAELGAIMHDRVHIRLDPHDIGRIVVYSHDRARFICIAECVDAMPAERQQRIALQAQAEQRKRLRVIRNDVRTVQKMYPSAGLADRILVDAGGDGFILADSARIAMDVAARPRLIAQREGIDALDASKAPATHIEPTAEQRADAAATIADFRARDAEPVQRMEQCDGYERPDFIGDDMGFFRWASARLANGEALDATDKRNFEQLRRDPTFALMVEIKQRA
ncbi:MAG: transposase family protein [Rhizomicrobium sp.]